MPTQGDFPSKWVCRSDDKEAIVEVRSPDGEDIEPELQLGVDRRDNGDAFIDVEVVGRPTPTMSELFVHIETQDGDTIWSLSIDHFTYNPGADRYEALVESENLDVSDDEPLYATTNGATAFSWIEIPTTEVELWIEKGEAAARQKTAKVKYPTEWGETPAGGAHNSPRQLIESFEPDDASPFMFGRVATKDDNDQWVTQHLGWIGGVGAAEGNNESKMWIYDFSEFFSGVPAGESFNNPSIETAVGKIVSIARENTSIPIAGATIVAPQAEEEIEQFSEGSIDQNDISGVSATAHNSLSFYSVPFFYGDLTFERGPPEAGSSADEEGDIYAYSVLGDVVASEEAREFESLIIDTQEGKFIPYEPDSKHFTANHDTLLDILNWFEEKTQCKVSFEPIPNARAVQMVFDIVPSRRTFADRAVIAAKEAEGDPIDFHEPATVTKNTALYEMKPTNTVHLRGSYPQGIVDDVWDGVSGALSILPGNDGPPPEKYPVVKAQVPALVEAANGTEVSGEVIESDSKSLEDAENEAVQKLSDMLGETSEGEVVMYGKPRLLPYDKVVAYEVCNGSIQYEQEPVEYEVQSVKHEVSSGEPFTTRVTVSVWANDDNIEITESKMVEVDR